MTRPARRNGGTLKEIFAIPAILGVLSGIGLIAALVGDGIYDVIGWATLGVPLAVIVRCLLRPHVQPHRKRATRRARASAR